jgi:hypothetical protein
MLKAILIRKLLRATKSSTMGVAALFLAGAGWLAAHPNVAACVAPQWGAAIAAGAAFLVAVARVRSL